MKVGMLWYDDDKSRTLEDKVRRAAAFYWDKYGRMPNLCLINPQLSTRIGSLPQVQVPANGGEPSDLGTLSAIELRTAPNVLLHHFWVGVGENGNGAGS